MSWFTGGASSSSAPARPQGKPGASDASASLLADWNSYSKAGPSDVETGGGTMASASVTAADAANKVSSFLQDSFTKVTTGVSSSVTAVTQSETFALPTGEALVYFFAFMAGGCVFLLVAFTLFLPTIILSPSKSALSFSLGSMCIMGGFAMLRGWKQQLTHMLSRERLPFSSAYIGSVVATLYAALIMKNYFLCLLCSGLQVVALLYYLLSYFPGGASGVKVVLTLFYNAALQCFGTVSRMVLK